MEYILQILIYIGIYTILSVSLNLLVGFTGILSIAHAAFYAVGAYLAALLAFKLQSPFALNILLAVIGAAMLGALVGIPSLRIKDDYFVIATFAFQIIVFSVLNNWVSLTGGPMGLPGIPQPDFFGVNVSTQWGFLILVTIFAVFTFWICTRIVKSPFGRVLKTIREDEIFAQSFGKNIAAFKVKVFMISAGLAAIAGAIYATYISFIDPTSFTIMESIFVISIVIIGGGGSLLGSIIGAVVLVSLPQLLRYIGLADAIAANVKQILYGALLVAFMLWRPQGFVGEYSYNRDDEKSE